MFDLWLLLGSISVLLVILFYMYVSFRKVEEEKSIRHIFSITPPTFYEGVVIIIIFLVTIKISFTS
ncbi:MAG: hypothetical protein QGH26_05550 [Candidatus Pacebacteria bacterium]|jgi:hypothetical protein|nr:hypothetical protein [Candidatus Paceibacterota bacterium]